MQEAFFFFFFNKNFIILKLPFKKGKVGFELLILKKYERKNQFC